MHEENQETTESEHNIQSATVNLEDEMGYSYTRYVSLGGRISEVNYSRVMKIVREESQANLAENFGRDQTKITADISGISLDAIQNEEGIDPRYIYNILRNDMTLLSTEDHHGQMSDQQLLVESLRMLGEEDAVQAIIAAHPHIHFN